MEQGQTLMLSKKAYLKQLKRLIKDDDVVVITSTVHGTMMAPTKRIPSYRIPFAFNEEAFKKDFGLGKILKTWLIGVCVVHKDQIDAKHLEAIFKEG